MIPIDIPRRAKQCCRGEEPFTQGMTYTSRITLLKDREYQREDFCPFCWEKEVKRTSMFPMTTWKGEVPKKTNIEKINELKADRLERALEVLRANLENAVEEDLKEAYFIALYLQRKKWLVSRGEMKRKAGPTLLYEVVSTEELIEIPKVNIKAEDIHLQERIAAKLMV